MFSFLTDLPQKKLEPLHVLYRSKKLDDLIIAVDKLLDEYPRSHSLLNMKSMALINQGRNANAKKVLTVAQKQCPNHPDAYNNMGTLLQREGEFKKAIENYKKVLEMRPDSYEAYNNIGIALQGENKFSNAIYYHKQAVHINSKYHTGYINLGLCHYQKKEFSTSLKYYETALSINPKNPVVHFNIGLVHQAQNHFTDATASYLKSLEIRPDFPEAANNLGCVYDAQGNYEKAVFYFTKAIRANGNYPEALNNLGTSFKNAAKFDKALAAFGKAISLKPDYPKALNNIGDVLNEQGKFCEAETYLLKAIQIDPGLCEAYNNLGISQKHQGNVNRAKVFYQKAISIKPDYYHALLNLGVLMEANNDLKQAKKYYQEALKINPYFVEAHYNLSKIITFTLNDTYFNELISVHKRPDLKNIEKIQISFALAKAYEDIEEYCKSLKFLEEANTLRRRVLDYEFETDVCLFSQIKSSTKSLPPNSLTISKTESFPIPIFIIGMPRSGTTLVEQIISAHSEVTGGGELTCLNSNALPIIASQKVIYNQTLESLRKTYLTKLKSLSKDKPFVTDKMPQNFYFLSLICKALPEAKIIHVNRDPAAVCWSNFKTNFSSKGLGYSNSLEDILNYYTQYEDLMSFWRSKYSDLIYEVNYEQLIVDSDKEIKNLIDFIGLPWEPDCLKPHKNPRFIQTASNQQVRKKIYSGSSDQWRHFEPFFHSRLRDAFKNLNDRISTKNKGIF